VAFMLWCASSERSLDMSGVPAVQATLLLSIYSTYCTADNIHGCYSHTISLPATVSLVLGFRVYTISLPVAEVNAEE
jgi:hypothetical protein